jgi:putative ABC transport system permease protein
MREWLAKFRGAPSDLRDEIEANLDLAAQEHIERGMSPAEAQAAARRGFGNVALVLERSRETWGFPAFDTLLQDLRYGLRGIRRSPSFSLVAILTLALGIGATTAIFSVVYAVLLRPLPYPHGERLVSLGEAAPHGEDISVTWINYRHWRSENHSFEDMAGYRTAHLTMTGRGEAVFTRAGVVTANLLPLTGAKALLGRVFNDADDRFGATPTVVLSRQFWAGKLGGDPKIVGSAIDLDGKAYEVIGVLAAGPAFFQNVDFYLPLGLSENPGQARGNHGSIRLLALLKPGATLRAGMADLDRIMQRLGEADPGPEREHRAYGRFLADSRTQEVRPVLLLLTGAVVLVLAIACANVASLMLARATGRGREIAIRSATGAGRLRISRQLLTESVLLASLGGAAGLLLAYLSLKVLLVGAPSDIPRLGETNLNLQVLGFAAVVSLFTGILAGCAPVLTAGKLNLVSALNESSRSLTGSKRGRMLRSALVIGEIAVTLVLAFASGLLIRSLIAAQTSDPGFVPAHLLEVELVLPATYKGPSAIQGFYNRLISNVHALPGVTDVGAVNCPPSAGDCGDWFYSMLDKPAPKRGDVPISLFNTADVDYFRTMHIPIREGRAFTAADRAGAPLVAVVNEAIARQWWPRETAVGRRIKVGGPYMPGPVYEIIGVAGNVSQMGLDTQPEPEIYVPFAQQPSQAMVLMFRTAGDPETIGPAVRRSIAAIDPNLPIESLRPFTKAIGATLDRRRFSTMLLALFALLAMVLAAVGIYGLLSFWVSAREDDIAIRMALGAQRWAIVRWTGLEALRLALAGVALGALAGWWASRAIESQVFGVPARSPLTIAWAAGAVMALAALASALPVWRATRVNVVERLHRG